MPASEAIAVPQIPIKWMCLGFCMNRQGRLNRNSCFDKLHLRIFSIRQIKSDRNTKRQRNIPLVHVSGTKPNRDRAVKITQRMQNRALQILLLFHRDALTHIAEDNSLYTLQPTCISKVQQQPVPLVGLCPNVFKEKNGFCAHLRSIRSTQCLRINRNAPTAKPALRNASTKHMQPASST